MSTRVDEPWRSHLADLVDSVRKLVTAIFNVNKGLAVRNIAAVYVGDS